MVEQFPFKEWVDGSSPSGLTIYLGMIFSSLSGYDIRETVKIWERMKEFNKGKAPPEFMSTHPSADNRIKKINEWINKVILEYPPIKIS